MAEKTITKKTKALLESIKDLWFFKVSDRFSAGIPDFIGVYRGIFFAIELKDKGKKPTKLQFWIMDKIREAGGKAIWTDKIDDVEDLLRRLKEDS